MEEKNRGLRRGGVLCGARIGMGEPLTFEAFELDDFGVVQGDLNLTELKGFDLLLDEGEQVGGQSLSLGSMIRLSGWLSR